MFEDVFEDVLQIVLNSNVSGSNISIQCVHRKYKQSTLREGCYTHMHNPEFVEQMPRLEHSTA